MSLDQNAQLMCLQLEPDSGLNPDL